MASAKRSKKKADPSLLARMVESARTGSAIASRWRCSGRVAGLDIAPRHTGITILSEEGIYLRSETIDYVLTREKKNDAPITEAQRIERMLSVANQVVGILKTWKVRWVGIEGYAMNAAFRAHQIGEVAGVIKSQLWLALKLVPEVVPPSAARKHLMGYGNPDKKQVVTVVTEGLGMPVKTDHEADAAVIARFTFDKKAAEQREIAP